MADKSLGSEKRWRRISTPGLISSQGVYSSRWPDSNLVFWPCGVEWESRWFGLSGCEVTLLTATPRGAFYAEHQ